MSCRAWLAGSATALVVALVAPRAQADTQFGVGLIGIAGGNFIDKPSDNTLGGQPAGDFYPGFGGFSGGGGLMLDARFLKLLGLEVDLMRTSDKGSGDVTQGGYKFTFKVGQSATHVPVLAKLVIPAPIVAPMFVLGPEFVFPGTPSVDVTGPATLPPITGVVNKYWMITMGAGLEIKLPLPVVDLRIPIQLRFSYNPKVSSHLDDRVAVEGGNIKAIGSEWKYVASATLGAALYF